MASTELFTLRWSEFHSNIAEAFLALLGDEDLSDVTLSVEGQNVRAHKLILSVGSTYFKELFKKTPCSHPVVILKDVTHKELTQLMQFMYRGEVNVCQEELRGFLQTAAHLQIKGLTGGQSPRSPQVSIQDEVDMGQSNNHQDLYLDASSYHGDDEVMPEVVPEIMQHSMHLEDLGDASNPHRRLLKNPKRKNGAQRKRIRNASDNMQPIHNTEIVNYFDHMPDDNKTDILPETAKESGVNGKSSTAKCPSCNRYFANRYNLKVHIRDKHDVVDTPLACNICQKTMRNPSCLRVHLYNHRRQAAMMSQACMQSENIGPEEQLQTCGPTQAVPLMPNISEYESTNPDIHVKEEIQ